MKFLKSGSETESPGDRGSDLYDRKGSGSCRAYLKQKLETEAPEQRDTISYLDRNSGKFCKGLTVTTFYLAKGLEFDRVYGVFMDSDKSPLKIQAEYITATRALHELFMYTVRG